MRDSNEIRYTNDDAIPEVRYTNDDVPYNEYEVVRTNPSAKEFGEDEPPADTSGSTSNVRFSSDFDVQKIASTFVVVSLVAMAVVLDESPFGEFFDPFMGEIAEAFGVSGVQPGYAIYCEVELVPADTEIHYSVIFEQVPDGKKLLTVREGSEVIQEIPLDTSLSGIIQNLVPGTTYEITVIVDGVVAGSAHTVSTLGTYDGTPIVKLLSAKNYNGTDRNTDDPNNPGGYFKFRLAVIDRGNVCSQFSADLEFEGQQFVCQFAGSPTDEQRIFIPDSAIPAQITAPLSGTLTVTWEVSGGQPGSLSETVYI